MTVYTPRSELLWRPDPNVDAARKLKDWARFHRVCGQHGVCFDHIERGKDRLYHCDAFTPQKVRPDLYHMIHLSHGTGRTVVAALADAFGKCGRSIPEAAEMIAAGLTGVSVDEFEDLLG